MSRYADFFATRRDSLDLLSYLEGRSPLLYVRWGHYDSPQAPTYETASDLPDLGSPGHGRKGDDRYLVLPARSALRFYKHQRPGGPEYEPQPRGGSPYVFFHSGGLYGDGFLITGEFWTAFESKEAVRFFDRFYRAVRTRFTRVEGTTGRSSHVGPEALGLLRGRRVRFTDGTACPPAIDLKLPRGWRAAEPGATPDRGGVTALRRSSPSRRRGR